MASVWRIAKTLALAWYPGIPNLSPHTALFLMTNIFSPQFQKHFVRAFFQMVVQFIFWLFYCLLLFVIIEYKGGGDIFEHTLKTHSL